MSERDQNQIIIDPDNLEGTLQQFLIYDLDVETLEMLARVVMLYPRPVIMYVDESATPFYSHTPLVDKFTFNMHTDELILFSRDPMTFIDALLEMAMYLTGFTTMIGVEESWKVEFAIGAWKPVKNRIKRTLSIPVIDEPLWVVGLSPTEELDPKEAHPFRTLVSRLDIASFTQMVRLASRDDVEVNFPVGTDPRVIEVYIRFKTAMHQVADGLLLENWREFNRRLLGMVQELEEEYQPNRLPVPRWWGQEAGANDTAGPQGDAGTVRNGQDQAGDPQDDHWDPFQSYLEQLLGDDSD